MKNGVKHGIGILRMEDQRKIIGVWQHNELNGLGASYTPNGAIDAGQFDVMTILLFRELISYLHRMANLTDLAEEMILTEKFTLENL